MKYCLILLSFLAVLSTDPFLSLTKKEAMNKVQSDGWVVQERGMEIMNEAGDECPFIIITKDGKTKRLRFDEEKDKVSGVITYNWDDYSGQVVKK